VPDSTVAYTRVGRFSHVYFIANLVLSEDPFLFSAAAASEQRVAKRGARLQRKQSAPKSTKAPSGVIPSVMPSSFRIYAPLTAYSKTLGVRFLEQFAPAFT
jgi:hypothetical protein